MHDIFARDPDPLDGLLAPSPSSENEGLRQSVYSQTQGVIRGRRRWRRGVYAVSLFVAFLVGAGAMRLNLPGRNANKDDSPNTDAKTTAERKPEARVEEAETTALKAEWTAFDSDEHRAELYRKAGDRYMKEENDLSSALRSYGNALDSSTEQDLAISTEDNWLLMAIKDARLKEKKDANEGG